MLSPRSTLCCFSRRFYCLPCIQQDVTGNTNVSIGCTTYLGSLANAATSSGRQGARRAEPTFVAVGSGYRWCVSPVHRRRIPSRSSTTNETHYTMSLDDVHPSTDGGNRTSRMERKRAASFSGALSGERCRPIRNLRSVRIAVLRIFMRDRRLFMRGRIKGENDEGLTKDARDHGLKRAPDNSRRVGTRCFLVLTAEIYCFSLFITDEDACWSRELQVSCFSY